jgi:membrane peptidoglycan carboxypeptidase
MIVTGVLAGAVLVLAGALAWALHSIQFPGAAEVTSRRVIVLTAADGQNLLQRKHLQLAPVGAKDMPVDVVNAVVSIEDRQ